MRIVIAASTAAATGLIAAAVLGVAGAETSTTTTAGSSTASPLRTVSVQGVAIESIDQSASAASATSVYRQGMADAITDGQAKAQFLAGKGGATLGPVQSMTEGGGYINCADEAGYLGAQPDFGSPGVSGSVVGASGGASRPAPGPVALRRPTTRRPKHHRREAAKKASAATCTLSTQVSLVYSLS
jgi:hypothetical protein